MICPMGQARMQMMGGRVCPQGSRMRRSSSLGIDLICIRSGDTLPFDCAHGGVVWHPNVWDCTICKLLHFLIAGIISGELR